MIWNGCLREKMLQEVAWEPIEMSEIFSHKALKWQFFLHSALSEISLCPVQLGKTEC